MVAKAGENAWRTGNFRCERCHERIHVARGKQIPTCPGCGHDSFDTRESEPADTSAGS